MKLRFLMAAGLVITIFVYMSSCYNNKADIIELPKVSLTKEIMPIMVGGGCGCHNANGAIRAEQFANLDTMFYDKILVRVPTHFAPWINGGTHPGGGALDFTPSEKALVKKWIDQGAPDDRVGCVITANITFTNTIQAEYNQTCKGGVCHGGVAANLDFNKMVAKKADIQQIMNSGGTSGHIGGQLSIGACVKKKFIEWINQGQPF